MSNTQDATNATKAGEESTEAIEEVTQVSIDDFNSLKKQLDDIKAAQQGSDRKVTEREKQLRAVQLELEEERKSKMSSDEKLEYELKLNEERTKQKEAQLQELERKVLLKDFLITKKLEASFEKYLTGSTVEELEKQAEELLTGIDAEVEKRIKEKFKTSTPAKGDSPSQNKNDIDEQIATAQKRGDFVQVMALKQQKQLQQ